MKTMWIAAGVACVLLGAVPARTADEAWRSLFDGKSLDGWKPAGFLSPGEMRFLPKVPPSNMPTNVPAGPAIYLGAGDDLTGIIHTNRLPTMNYEVRLEAMRVSGGDFFCGLTFPVDSNHCTLVVGGWGGGLVGISSIDGMDASENETSSFEDFKNGTWYEIGVRVTPGRLEAWIDGKQVVNVNVEDRRISMRAGEIEDAVPFGVSCWRTASAVRNIRIRDLPPPAGGRAEP